MEDTHTALTGLSLWTLLCVCVRERDHTVKVTHFRVIHELNLHSACGTMTHPKTGAVVRRD